MNPDGSEYDIATGSYRSWRKNRQPNSGSSNVGTDLNRNWGYQWGCCGGSSGTHLLGDLPRPVGVLRAGDPARCATSSTAGWSAASQQIKANIDFHTYSQLVLWPYGYTTANTATGLNADQQQHVRDHRRQQMAATNGYTPEQSSDLYIADGTSIDWMWAHPRIFAYTFEMYPGSAGGGGFYPPDEVITAQTTRNREAVLILSRVRRLPVPGDRQAGPVLRRRRRHARSTPTPSRRPPAGPPTRPAPTPPPPASGSAVTRRPPRPAAPSSSAPPSAAPTTWSPARLAGAAAGDFDVDGGATSIRSPAITLPASGTLTLSPVVVPRARLNSSSADFFRVSVVHSGGTTARASPQAGAASNRNGAWAVANANLSAYAGQSVRILIEAADASTASLVEAGVDDVRITQS